jgi:hypothetical protein
MGDGGTLARSLADADFGGGRFEKYADLEACAIGARLPLVGRGWR